MALTILNWIVGIMFVIVISLLGYLLYNRFKEREEPDDAPFIDIYGTQYSNGHSKAVLVNMDIGEKRIKMVVSPRDLNYKRIQRTGKLPEIKTIFFDKRQVENLSDLSTHRQIIACYPNTPDDLPEGFKETKLGKSIMNIITENNKLNDESSLMKERLSSLQEIASKDFGGKIMTQFSEIAMETLSDKSELTRKDEKKPFDKK